MGRRKEGTKKSREEMSKMEEQGGGIRGRRDEEVKRTRWREEREGERKIEGGERKKQPGTGIA